MNENTKKSAPRRCEVTGFPSAVLDFPGKHNYNKTNIVCIPRTDMVDKTEITEGFL